MAYRIEFEPIGIRLISDEAQTVYEAARQAGLGLHSSCAGKGTCGKCRVRLRDGPVPPPLEAEREHIPETLLAEGWRLACRTIVSANLTIYVPPALLEDAQILQTEGVETAFTPRPAVRLLPAAVAPPSLSDQAADLARLEAALREQHGVKRVTAGLPALQAMRTPLRVANWQVSVALRGDELIAVYAAGQARPVGLAVDIGTTKLACYLVDLESGRVLSLKGMANPQIVHGEDIMSRLEAVMVDPAYAERLQHEVVAAINAAAEELCAAQGLTPDHLLEVCLVGNTAMHHLAAGLPVRPLAVSPFVPALSRDLDVEAARLGLRAAPGARVYLPAPLAGFVGSDHLAFLLASGFGQDDRVRLGIDIGTNTEIALQAAGRILTCSTASGPAFEGAHIRYGMRAAPGAIQHIEIAPDGGVACDVIGDLMAVGICGSGVLDALAEMCRAGILNERGRMQPRAPGVEANEGGPAFTLVQAGHGQGAVTISQLDIDQILLAKGAIRTGIDVLMDILGVTPDSLEEIVVAGAFGSYLSPASAIRIGLFPAIPLERIHSVGNAAGIGARMLLASTDCRQQANRLAQRIEYVELTLVPGFNRHFARAVRLPVV